MQPEPEKNRWLLSEVPSELRSEIILLQAMYRPELEELIKIARALEPKGLTIDTAGNVSIRIGKFMVITPSGHDYETLRPDHLVVVEIDTGKEYGHVAASSEALLHLEIYRVRNDVNAVVHGDAFYSSCVEEDVLPVHHMVIALGGSRHRFCVTKPYEAPGSEELAERTKEALGDGWACYWLMHGVVGVGKNLKEAFRNARWAERTAGMQLLRKRSKLPGEPLEVINGEQIVAVGKSLKRYAEKAAKP